MPDPGYIERTVQRAFNGPMFHSSACLTARVDAFCDDTPDTGCTCGRTTAIQARRTGCEYCGEPRCGGTDCPAKGDSR